MGVLMIAEDEGFLDEGGHWGARSSIPLTLSAFGLKPLMQSSPFKSCFFKCVSDVDLNRVISSRLVLVSRMSYGGRDCNSRLVK